MSHDEVSDAEIEAIRSALHDLFVELDIGDFAAKSWARAAILAYRAALRAEGYKVLAREPTGKMWNEGRSRFGMEAERYSVLEYEKAQAWADTAPASIWRAMWDAAPEES